MGVFVIPRLEHYLSEVSKQTFLTWSPSQQPPEKATLHIMTMASRVGGHTKVVTHWINLDTYSEFSSVFFTSKKRRGQSLSAFESLPRRQVYFATGGNLGKARELRKTAERFERIVLHTHFQDIVPSLAFGDGYLKDRIVRFNHADHRYWVGASLASVTAESRSWGAKVSRELRGVASVQVVGLPNTHTNSCSCDSVNPINRTIKKLRIQPHMKVLLAVGTYNKFKPIGNQNFPELIAGVLEEDPKTSFLGVGIRRGLFIGREWLELTRKYPKRVRLTGNKSPAALQELYHSAFLGIDSFPMSGSTVVQEMLHHKLRVVHLECATGHMDDAYLRPTFAKGPEEWKIIVRNELGALAQESRGPDGASNHHRARNTDWNNSLDHLWAGSESELVKSISAVSPTPNIRDLNDFLRASMTLKGKALEMLLSIFINVLGFLERNRAKK